MGAADFWRRGSVRAGDVEAIAAGPAGLRRHRRSHSGLVYPRELVSGDSLCRSSTAADGRNSIGPARLAGTVAAIARRATVPGVPGGSLPFGNDSNALPYSGGNWPGKHSLHFVVRILRSSLSEGLDHR